MEAGFLLSCQLCESISGVTCRWHHSLCVWLWLHGCSFLYFGSFRATFITDGPGSQHSVPHHCVQGLAALLGINPARICVVSVGGGSFLSSSLDTRLSALNAKAHRNIHLLQVGQSLVIEILDDKPTIPIDTADTAASSSSSASMGNASAAKMTAASATNQADVANQQVRMAVLGSKLATLAASGSIARTLNNAGVTVTGLNVTVPQVSVAPPVVNAVGSSGSPFFIISINITFAGAARSKFVAAVTAWSSGGSRPYS